MTIYDYAVIAFYLLFMLMLGPIYKSFSKTASDYFRGGGGMLWWVVGSSAFMTNFSAWSFTGGAAKAYETGTFFFILFACNFVALWFAYFFTAPRYRQMRIVTPIEAVRNRYGNNNEQVFAWLPLISQVFFGGIALYTISIFMSGVFGIRMEYLIIALGLVVTFMTLVGGSWAATAGDFVQMLVVITITLVMSFLTLRHPDIGGISGLLEKMPSRHFNWSEFSRPWVVGAFAFTLLLNQIVQMNSMMIGAARYVFVKNGKDAKKAVLVSIVGFLLLSPIWMIPAVASAVLNTDMASMYPSLKNANEAAYVAIAMQLLPQGLIGLLVCAIFAATLTTMNSALNIASGTFVRNFYIRIVNKNASELKQIFVGRIFILVYGALWIIAAMFFNSLKEIKLFDLILLCAASVGIPTAVPLFLGMFIKRTPAWSAWATLVTGFAVAVALRFILVGDFIQNLFNPAVPFNSNEVGDLNIALTTGILFVVCTSVYMVSMLFYKNTSLEYRKQVDEFFEQMNTPIDMVKEKVGGIESDKRQYGVLSTLCMVYGGVVLLLLLIPNTMQARACILFCGGLILVIGLILRIITRRLRVKSV